LVAEVQARVTVDRVEGLKHAAGDPAVFGDGDLDGVKQRSTVLGRSLPGGADPAEV
jgi:hypothetical protein